MAQFTFPGSGGNTTGNGTFTNNNSNTFDVVILATANASVVTNTNPLPVAIQSGGGGGGSGNGQLIGANTSHIGNVNAFGSLSTTITDPASGNTVTVVNGYALDNQAMPGGGQTMATAAFGQLLNANGKFDRVHSVAGDNQAPTGLQAIVPMLWNGVAYDRYYGNATVGAFTSLTTGLPTGANQIGNVSITSMPPISINASTVTIGDVVLGTGSNQVGNVSITALPQIQAQLYSNSTAEFSNTNPVPVSIIGASTNTQIYSNTTAVLTNANPLPVSVQLSNTNSNVALLSNSTTLITNAIPLPVSVQIANAAIPLATGSNQVGNVSITAMPGLPTGANVIGNVSISSMPAITIGGLSTGANVIGGVEVFSNSTTIFSNSNPVPISIQISNAFVSTFHYSNTTAQITNANPFPVSLQISNAISNVSLLSNSTTIFSNSNPVPVSVQISNAAVALATGSNQIGNVSITAMPAVVVSAGNTEIYTNTTTTASNANPFPVSLQISNAFVNVLRYSNTTAQITNSNPAPVSLQISNATVTTTVGSGLPTGANVIGSVVVANGAVQLLSNSTAAVTNANPLPVSASIVVPNTVIYSNTITAVSNTNPFPVSLQISNATVTTTVGSGLPTGANQIGNVSITAMPAVIVSAGNTEIYTNTTTTASNSNPFPVSLQISNATVTATIGSGLPTGANLIGNVSITYLPKSALTMGTVQNTVSTTANQVFAANATCVLKEFYNTSSNTIYIGGASTVTSSNGFPVMAGCLYDFTGYNGALWAITASGTSAWATIAY